MKEWLTAQELAGECLPHLPSTKRGINDLAIREGWNQHPAFARPRKGRGGGTEYHIRLLPALASLEYQRRYRRLGLVDLPTAANDEEAVPASRLSARASLERDARLAIIKHFDSFRSGLRLNQQGAMQAFVDRYNARTLHIEDWVLELVETISKGSLKRWIQKHRRGAPIGVDIELDKRIPVGAGLGGGSSNAATTLIALNRLWNLGFPADELADIGLPLGADIPVFVRGHAAWAEGIGERLSPIDLPEPWYLLLLPPVTVATATVFADPTLERAHARVQFEDYSSGICVNDCEPVTTRLFPPVAEALAWLRRFGPARMSGTGACVFLEAENRAAADTLAAQADPAWRPTVVRGLNRSPLAAIMRGL